MKIFAIQYGKTVLSESMAFKGGATDKSLPISLLFFLIETEDKKILVDVGCDTMPGFELLEFERPVTALEKLGVNREEITDVIITHSHHDHIDALRYYKNARVFLHSEGVNPAKNYLFDGIKLFVFDDSFEVAKNVVAEHVGSHSPDSCIVKVNDKYVLCGDECYTRENLEKVIPSGSCVCLEKNVEFIKKYREKPFVPLIFHDPELVGKIGYRVIFEDLS